LNASDSGALGAAMRERSLTSNGTAHNSPLSCAFRRINSEVHNSAISDLIGERVLAGLVLLTIFISLVSTSYALEPQKSISQFTHTSWSARDGIPVSV
jgi:hypothetical protein